MCGMSVFRIEYSCKKDEKLLLQSVESCVSAVFFLFGLKQRFVKTNWQQNFFLCASKASILFKIRPKLSKSAVVR